VEVLTFLGIEFDTIRMELRLPKEKLFAINHILTIVMHSKKISLRQLQSLIGLLNFKPNWSKSDGDTLNKRKFRF
jgi:hypothetical protein